MADGTSVVLKVLDPKHSRPRDLDRLRNELDLARTLTGLAIVEPIRLSTFQGLPALELDDFSGKSLDAFAGEPMEVGAFLSLGLRIASAVADIHARGLIHKDLKPSNILFDDKTAEVKIANFSIASRMAREQTSARPARLIEGSLPYVSPEQTGWMNRAIDSRSDLYSLGVTFYQLLTGQLPFTATDPLGWVYCHVARKPAPPDEVRPSIPHHLSDLILKLLAKVPDDRYQSASGLAHDLGQCLAQWRERARIEPFALGQRDASDRFLIPQKLYGRAGERQLLWSAFDRVATTGTPELFLVSGTSGIGKSSVVHELHRPIAAAQGLYVAGKFEQYRRDVPYFTIVRAFREVMLDILAESADSVAAWRQRLQAAVGTQGQLIVDLIPQVALVIGPQPPVAEVAPGEAENRLRKVLRELLGAFATEAHPVTLFLDDLQWADPASLRLLIDLVTPAKTRHLLVIGAYRDNEVGPSHPLMRALDEARGQGAHVETLVLGPLPKADIADLVADTMHCSASEAAPLVRLLSEKTGGNPYFVVQFLTDLHRQGLVVFDANAGRWRWDLARIRTQGYADNVVDLMVAKIRDLPPEAQEALELAACLGATIDTEMLALVFGRDPRAALRAAFEADLLLPVNGSHRFPHDRVQEAAYSLIPEGERASVHLRIGRRLLEQTPPAELEEGIFEIVNQLNRGAILMTSNTERDRAAELNLLAGRRAQRSTAYASALRYFTQGTELLGDEPWARRHELTFALELHRAEGEFLTGEIATAEKRLADLNLHATNVVDAAAVAGLRVNLYTTLDQPQQAVEACLQFLRRVGIEWGPHPTSEEVQEEFARMWQRLGERPIEGLIDLPAMSEPKWRAAVDVLMIATAPASFTDENLCCLAVGRAVNLSLEHGNTDGSSQAYVLLGELLGPYFDDYRLAFRFGRLGFDLMEKNGPLRFKALVYMCFAILVNPWTQHVRSSIDLERRALEYAEQTGNLQVASYAHNDITTLLLAAGDPLAEVERAVEDGLGYVRSAKFGLVVDTLVTKLRLIRTLRGLTPRFGSFDGDGFDEAAFEQRLEAAPNLAIAAAWYWIRKLQARTLALEHAAATEAAAKAEPLLWTSRSHIEITDFRYFAALAHAGAWDEAPAERQPEHAAAVAEHLRHLDKWAENGPDNFRDRAALVRAELARIRGDAEEAARLYDEAIRAARDGGFVHNAAIACETAAHFYRRRGFSFIADAYLREARENYLRWGAEGKVGRIDQMHPGLAEAGQIRPTATVALEADRLDLLSVVKASQSISSVMVGEQVLHKLLRAVLEAGGARRAVVLLADRGQIQIAAEVTPEGVTSASPPASDRGLAPSPRAGSEPPATTPPLRTGVGTPAKGTPRQSPSSAAANLPGSILDYVSRTQQRVVLADAASEPGRFSREPYLSHTRPRSVLCLPIRRQGEAMVLLYLENDLVPGAFTPERLLVLELLATQTAISLENARLLEREHAGRVGAEAAEARALLLGEATELMTATSDYQGVFGALTRLCVRWFADWAIIDLADGGNIVRLAGAHRDPNKEPFLRELSERYPANASSRAPAAIVLTTGKPLLVAVMDEAYWRSHAADEHHLEVIRQLETRSAVIVPLVARDVILGALTLASSTPGRFGPADLELATEIGRRAALAIDNARLLRETQRAVQLRDEFLSIASHELRTPLTSLKVRIEYLLRAWRLDNHPRPPRLGADPPANPLSSKAVEKNLQRIKLSADRLQKLTNELLDVTRIERGRIELEPVDVELGELVRQVVDDLAMDLAGADCTVRIDADDEVTGTWDRSRLEQVITNLLSNSVKFGRGHPIDIRIRNADDAAELSVQDYGIGIDPGRQRFVFDRFWRAASASHYGGLGLGLYIARTIVRAHGGELRVESEPGHGATFTVTLPRLLHLPLPDQTSVH